MKKKSQKIVKRNLEVLKEIKYPGKKLDTFLGFKRIKGSYNLLFNLKTLEEV